MAKTDGARGFGSIENRRRNTDGTPNEKDPAYRAAFTGPDGRRHVHSGTFATKGAAEEWLNQQRRDIDAATLDKRPWIPPELRKEMVTFAEQAATYMRRPLKPKTMSDYQGWLDGWLLPEFGNRRLDAITAAMVTTWHNALCPGTPAQRAHIYSLGHAILESAVRSELIDRNPFRIQGAMKVKRTVSLDLPSELEVGLAVMAMPDRYRAALQISAGMGLRSGEVRALQRGDVDLTSNTLRVRRGVTQVAKRYGGVVVGTPKTKAGVRDLPMPDWLVKVLQWHLAEFVGPRDDAWLFTTPGSDQPLFQNALWDAWDGARTTAGIPECRFHNLRRYAATVASIKAHATMDEVRRMLGQDDIGVTALYLDEFKGRAEQIAQAIPSQAVTQTAKGLATL